MPVRRETHSLHRCIVGVSDYKNSTRFFVQNASYLCRQWPELFFDDCFAGIKCDPVTKSDDHLVRCLLDRAALNGFQFITQTRDLGVGGGGGGGGTITRRFIVILSSGWSVAVASAAASALPLRRRRKTTNKPNRRAPDVAATAHTGTRDLLT